MEIIYNNNNNINYIIIYYLSLFPAKEVGVKLR
jgi:hypothetical protein